MMAEWPWNLMGYNAADYGAGLPEDESGLAEDRYTRRVHGAGGEAGAAASGAQLPQEARGGDVGQL
jgi:hypothetical protein